MLIEIIYVNADDEERSAFINPDHVVSVAPFKDYAWVYLTAGRTYKIKDSITQLINLINQNTTQRILSDKL